MIVRTVVIIYTQTPQAASTIHPYLPYIACFEGVRNALIKVYITASHKSLLLSLSVCASLSVFFSLCVLWLLLFSLFVFRCTWVLSIFFYNVVFLFYCSNPLRIWSMNCMPSLLLFYYNIWRLSVHSLHSTGSFGCVDMLLIPTHICIYCSTSVESRWVPIQSRSYLTFIYTLCRPCIGGTCNNVKSSAQLS